MLAFTFPSVDIMQLVYTSPLKSANTLSTRCPVMNWNSSVSKTRMSFRLRVNSPLDTRWWIRMARAGVTIFLSNSPFS